MSNANLIPIEKIEKAIYLIRGEKVMLDRDLADLYGVGTHVLKQAVRRNKDRFPEDFMFVLNPTEFRDWRSQFVISKLTEQDFVTRQWPLLNKVWRCSQAFYVVSAPYPSTSKSCAHS